jgi:hypothetical protein
MTLISAAIGGNSISMDNSGHKNTKLALSLLSDFVFTFYCTQVLGFPANVTNFRYRFTYNP